jgi:hypothetical protein
MKFIPILCLGASGLFVIFQVTKHLAPPPPEASPYQGPWIQYEAGCAYEVSFETLPDGRMQTTVTPLPCANVTQIEGTDGDFNHECKVVDGIPIPTTPNTVCGMVEPQSYVTVSGTVTLEEDPAKRDTVLKGTNSP